MEDGFTAGAGGVPEGAGDAPATAGSVTDAATTGSEVSAGTTTAAAGTAAGSGGTTQPRMVPETDINNMRSVYDKKIAGYETQVRQLNEQVAQFTQFQQVMEQAALDERWAAMEARGEDTRAERNQYSNVLAARAEERAQATLKSEREAMARERAQTDRMAAPIVAFHVAREFGLDPNDESVMGALLECQTADEMKRVARTSVNLASRSTLKARQEAGIDKMDGSGGGSVAKGWENLSPEGKIEWALAHPKGKR